MAGTETARFDLVMQFSEDAYRELLGVFFDSGILSSIAELIPGVSGDIFTVDVSFDRPTGIALEGSGENPIDIRIGFGEGGALATLRMVVGVNVNRASLADIVQIDFAGSMYFAQVTVAGDPLNLPGLRTALQAILPALPVLPVPVNRSTTDPTQIQRADFRIIDDSGAGDRDATSAMLTFGGGSPGDASSLRSFVPEGGRGAIGVFFRWLCRIAAPRMEAALELPAGSFDIADDRCSLNRTVMVGPDDDVELRSLTLSLDDGFISIAARVAKSGFCYDATGDVSARLRLEIRDGRLVATAEIGDPDVDVSIPWYCWLAAGVIGAALGGVLLGVIGAIVGAILVPLIMWLAVDVVEGTIDRVIDEIRDAINEAIPEIDVPAFGIRIVFQRVFIDDIVIQASLNVEDHSPVRAQGVVVLRPGQGLDLDTGRVGGPEMAEADIAWKGRADSRHLATGCQARLARTGTTDFDGFSRFELYGYAYESRAVVPLYELGIENPLADLPLPFPIPGVTDDDVFERRYVYAMKTNEGRYAVVQAIEVQDDYVRLRYKTYETSVPAVSIAGDFKCDKGRAVPVKGERVTFEPANKVQAAGVSITEAEAVRASTMTRRPRVMAMVPSARPCDEDHGTGEGTEGASDDAQRPCARVFPLPDVPDGRWVAELEAPMLARARLEAVSSGTRGKVSHLWQVGGQRLEDQSKGEIVVEGIPVAFEVSGKYLALEVDPSKAVELFVKVTVIDDRGCDVSAARCVRHHGKCKVLVRKVPTFRQFQDLLALPPPIVEAGAVSIEAGLVVPRPVG